MNDAPADALATCRFDEILWSGSRTDGPPWLSRGIAAWHLGLAREAGNHFKRWAAENPCVATGPLVSIVVPTFNRPELLRRALRSIAHQLYRPIEAVVVNDAGLPIGAILDEFRPALDIVERTHPNNRYLAACRNSGLAAARGFWVGYLDDDDQLYPHHVAHLVALLQLHGARAAAAAALMHDAPAIPGGPERLEPFPYRPFELAELLHENVSPVQTVLHERSLADEIGGFDPALTVNEDWEFWIRLRHRTPVSQSRVPTSCVDRRHDGARMTARRFAPFVAAHQTIYQRHRDKAAPAEAAEIARRQADYLTSLRARAEAEIAARRCLRIVINGADPEGRARDAVEAEVRTWRRAILGPGPEPVDFVAEVGADFARRARPGWLISLAYELEADPGRAEARFGDSPECVLRRPAGVTGAPARGVGEPLPAPVAILAWHRVLRAAEPDPFRLAVSQDRFEEQIRALAERFRIVSLDEAFTGAHAEDPRPRVAVTFDDGYRDNYQFAFPVLAKLDVPAALFVATGAIESEQPFWWEVLAHDPEGTERQREWRFMRPAERAALVQHALARLAPEERGRLRNLAATWPMLAEIAADPRFSIGAHTRHHSSLGRLDAAEVEAEIRGSIDDLRALLGLRPRYFAFPHGSPEDLSPHAPATLAALGIERAFTTRPGTVVAGADPYSLPRFVVGDEPGPALVERLERALGPTLAPTARQRSIVVLSGISASNLGDDAMLVATVRELRALDPSASLTVLAENPGECGPIRTELDVTILPSLQLLVQHYLTVIDPTTCRAEAIRQLAHDLLAVRDSLLAGAPVAGIPEPFLEGLRLLMSADGVIDCGGANLCGHWKSYFYEKCLDYLVAARPLVITGQGIDRFDDEDDRALLAEALDRASEVTVRERTSERHVRALRATIPVLTTGDDALTLAAASPERRDLLLGLAGLPRGARYLAFQYRHYLDYHDDRFLDFFAACIDAAADRTGLFVVGVPMHFAGTDERDHLERVASRLGRAERFRIVRSRITPEDAKALFGGSRLTFGISYHSAVFALSAGTPYLGLYRGTHYCQKMLGLAELWDLPDLALPIDGLSAAEFGERVVLTLARRDELSRHLADRQQGLSAAVSASRRRFLDRVRPAENRARPAPVPWHDLRRLEPVSRRWGFDRGLPIDRFYIESFLESESARIRGVVCELLNDQYVRRFGGDRLTQVAILDIDETNSRATIVDDLTAPQCLPEGHFDCFLLTQTLPYIHECGKALATAYRSLKPGGALLVTVPSIIKFHREPEDHWRFTPDSLERLIRDHCPGAAARIESHGNLLAAVASLHGMAVEDLSVDELRVRDPEYPLVVSARILRPA